MRALPALLTMILVALGLTGVSAPAGAASVPLPTAPSGLAVLSTTSTAVSLSWNGSTDNLVVSGYNIFRGTTKVATVPGTTGTVTGLTPSTNFTFSVQAVDEVGNVSANSNTVTA